MQEVAADDDAVLVGAHRVRPAAGQEDGIAGAHLDAHHVVRVVGVEGTRLPRRARPRLEGRVVGSRGRREHEGLPPLEHVVPHRRAAKVDVEVGVGARRAQKRVQQRRGRARCVVLRGPHLTHQVQLAHQPRDGDGLVERRAVQRQAHAVEQLLPFGDGGLQVGGELRQRLPRARILRGALDGLHGVLAAYGADDALQRERLLVVRQSHPHPPRAAIPLRYQDGLAKAHARRAQPLEADVLRPEPPGLGALRCGCAHALAHALRVEPGARPARGLALARPLIALGGRLRREELCVQLLVVRAQPVQVLVVHLGVARRARRVQARRRHAEAS